MHPIFSARKTVHAYRPDPVDEAAVERALQAAVLAPCHRFTWPWRFTRVGPETRAQLHAIGAKLKFPEGVPERMKEKVWAKFNHPQLLVVSQIHADDAFQAKEDYAAVACAIQNLCLSLADDGIASKWGTGGVTRDARTYQLLGIDPEVEEIVGFIWFGHPAEDKKRPARDPLVLRTVP